MSVFAVPEAQQQPDHITQRACNNANATYLQIAYSIFTFVCSIQVQVVT